MFLTKSSVPMEPVRQRSTTIVTTERPFIHPVMSFVRTSSVQTIGGVVELHWYQFSAGHVTGPVKQPSDVPV